DAAATEKMGSAKAVEIREKLVAEATGIEQKATALRQFDDATRAHEEYRLRLEKTIDMQMRGIEAKERIAQAQASVMAGAMANAKINIVGGDGQFFDRFVNAVSLGHAVDGLVGSGETTQTLLSGYLNGQRSLPEDLKDILANPRLDSETLKNLSISGVLGKLAVGLDDSSRGKVDA